MDFDDGVVWVLALGSDAARQALLRGRTDAIQLSSSTSISGRAAGIGVPRDLWVDLPQGRRRINRLA